jgi:hypothetical protein
MAFRKEIFLALKKKYPNAPKTVLDKVTDHVEKDVPEDGDFETAAENAGGLVATFTEVLQSETDRRVAEALKKKGVKPDAKDEDEDPANPVTGKDDKDTPAWAKQQNELISKLMSKVESLEQGKTIDLRKQTLEEKLKGVDNEIFKNQTLKNFARMKFETDEEFDTYLEEIEADGAEFVQNLSNQSLGSQTKPFSGNQKTGKEASKEEVATVINDIM